MKKIALILAGAAVLFLASCSKSETDTISVTDTKGASDATATIPAAVLSAWKPVTLKAGETIGKTRAYSVTIDDAALTPDVLSTGMVLVYKQSGNEGQALPFMQKDISWHYDVAEGSLTITADAGASQTLTPGENFSYVILTGAQLGVLQGKGYSKGALIGLSYAAAANLFK